MTATTNADSRVRRMLIVLDERARSSVVCVRCGSVSMEMGELEAQMTRSQTVAD